VAYINRQPDLELMLQPDLGIFCLRLVPQGVPGEHFDALQKFLYEKMLAEARRSVSFTRIRDRAALRFLILTPEQTVAEIVKTLDYLRALAAGFIDNPQTDRAAQFISKILTH
jgi:glutamate/tyrosine decarboxylase-like PLP-dependent enzyme